MSDRILELLKEDMNGLSLEEIRKEISGAQLSHMKELVQAGKVRYDSGLYKATPAAWE